MTKQKRLTGKQQIKAVAGVAGLSFRVAPLAVIFKLVGAIVDAVLPIATTYFAALTTTALVLAYDGDQQAGKRAMMYVIITAFLALATTAWRSLDGYIQARMRLLVEARVSDRMYLHFLSLDFWRYDDKDTIDLYDRAIKFSSFFAWIFDRIASLASQMIGMVGSVIALMFVEPLLALGVLIAMMPGVIIQFKLSRQQITHWNKNVEVRRTRNMLEWQLGQPKTISELRLYGMVQYLLGHRDRLRNIDEQARIDFEKQFLPKRLLADIFEAIAELGALLWIIAQIVARSQPVGQFLYVQQIVSRAMGSAGSFVSTLGGIDEDIANLFDYEQFMQLPTHYGGVLEITEPPQRIVMENVSFTYPSSKHEALSNISLTIEKNQHIAIVGENGAGKSTLIKLLTGLYRPSAGRIMLDGIDLNDFETKSWHRQLGVLQQDFISYTFATAGDNVRFGDVDGKHSPERLDKALKEAEASDFVAKLPKGLDTYVNTWIEDSEGNKGSDLSGGQWQRLALARDFYRNAPIVILDEPTSAIDALAESRIFKRLFAESQRTVITISHRMSTIEQADIIYMLEEGKLVEAGSHSELVAKKGRYYRMFKTQIEKTR